MISVGNFIKHKPPISEECSRKNLTNDGRKNNEYQWHVSRTGKGKIV